MRPSIQLAFILVLALARALSQNETNGASLWGTLDTPVIPSFLTPNESDPLPSGFPWGSRTANDSNPYKDVPDTGVVRYYEFTLSRAQIAPDGYLKNVMLINGQFPGPMIEANWGDLIEGDEFSGHLAGLISLMWIPVQVSNDISGPEEGTALHWHGLLQTATPWYDGPPSVQQCPVAPGATFT